MTAPVRVVAVDVTATVPAIGSAGGRYAGARIFAFAGPCPIGETRVDLPAAGLSSSQVAELIARAGLAADVPPPRCAGPAAGPLISVVVATDLGRPQALERCLAALEHQDHPRREVILVVNRAGGDGSSRLALPPGVRVAVEPRPGASAARNRGLAVATGEVVAFTDDDAVPGPSWLSSIAARFADEPDAGAVTGLVLPGELETPAQVWFEESGNAFAQRYRRASFAGGPFTVGDRLAGAAAQQPIYAMGPFGTGCNMAFRREVLTRLGGFDPALGPGTPARAGEDLLLLLRLLAEGGRLAYEPSAVVWHSHRAGAEELRRQVAGYGRGFTAMLTAAVLQDPRHLRGMAQMVARMVAHRRAGTAPAGNSGAPAWLARSRRWGEVLGPGAYVAARLRLLRWRRQAPGVSG